MHKNTIACENNGKFAPTGKLDSLILKDNV